MILGIDMDGVIANFTKKALENIKEEWGVELNTNDIVEPRMAEFVYYNFLSDADRLKFNNPREMYSKLCPPGFFEELEPYNGAIDTLKELSKEHEIVIITKPLEWTNCPGEKRKWLRKYLMQQLNLP